jgi:hypothetical protein
MFYFRIFLLFVFSTPLAAAPSFVQCYDFGCKSTQELHYSADHWRQIRALFEQEKLDIEQEKQAIRRAVAREPTSTREGITRVTISSGKWTVSTNRPTPSSTCWRWSSRNC